MSSDKKVVYICHPFKDNMEENREKVRGICEAVKHDVVPLAPHLLLPHYMEEATERVLALEHGLKLVSKSDELWVMTKRITEGMKLEIEEAEGLKIPVIYKQDK